MGQLPVSCQRCPIKHKYIENINKATVVISAKRNIPLAGEGERDGVWWGISGIRQI